MKISKQMVLLSFYNLCFSKNISSCISKNEHFLNEIVPKTVIDEYPEVLNSPSICCDFYTSYFENIYELFQEERIRLNNKFFNIVLCYCAIIVDEQFNFKNLNRKLLKFNQDEKLNKEIVKILLMINSENISRHIKYRYFDVLKKSHY